MQSMNDLARIAFQIKPSPGDRRENGVIVCGHCGEAKQQWANMEGSGPILIPRMCRCSRERAADEERRREQAKLNQTIAELRQMGLWNPGYERMIFQRDDAPQSPESIFSRKYLNQWPRMRKEGIGILYYGSIGTGKTYYAACIANGVMKQYQEPAYVTSVPQLLNQLQNGDNTKDLIATMNRSPLLVIDDLGTERNTDYALEQLFSVIDARSISGKPALVTTNLSPQEMRETKDLRCKRIYDRILEMCPLHVQMTGPSRRQENATKRKNETIALMKQS